MGNDDPRDTAIRSLLVDIETMLRDPTCEVSVQRSIVQRRRDESIEFDVRDRERTVTIKINGGARQG
jgi:hypothetical protein